MAILHSTY